MKKIPLNPYDKLFTQKTLEEQITREVEILKQFNPDVALIHEFESASLSDLQKHLNEL